MKLREGTFLQGGKYKIIKLLGQGGFGITYLAEQVALGRKVAIKEFFMRDYCERDKDTSHVSMGTSGSREMVEKCRRKFIKEAKTIAQLNHSHIIPIYDIFEENNTAYYVMKYIDSGSLSDKINNCGLSEAVALRYIRQVADALGYIHKKSMNHLDVKPGNVLIDEEDNAVLIDFGLAKHYNEEGQQTTTTPVGISHGYAPTEQYKSGGVSTFSPATDIYSLGATLYKALTAVVPPEAATILKGVPTDRLADKGVSPKVINAIVQAMQADANDRPQSVAEFLALLDGKGATPKGGAVPPRRGKERTGETTIIDGDKENTAGQSAKKNSGDSTNTPEPDKEKKPKRGMWILLAVLLGFVVGAVGYYLLSGNSVIQQEAANEQTTIVADSVQTINADSIAKARQDSILRHHKDSLDRANKQRQDSLDQARIEAEQAEQERLEAEQAEQERKAQEAARQAALEAAQTYKVGDYYNRDGVKGVVFAVWDGGRHGKIVSMDESSNHLQWCTDEQYDKEIAVGASSHTDGKANTDKIAKYGLSNYPAAQWCRKKGSNWYLPAKNELVAIYNNKSVINATLNKYGGMKLRGAGEAPWYWSSTEREKGDEWYENPEISAWSVYMDDGDTDFDFKSGNLYVRAVSAF